MDFGVKSIVDSLLSKTLINEEANIGDDSLTVATLKPGTKRREWKDTKPTDVVNIEATARNDNTFILKVNSEAVWTR